jgi:hypothetical protein
MVADVILSDVLPSAPTTTDDALTMFDAAAAVEPTFMIGTWHGAELPTGHPLDGLLAASGWWGKQFNDGESVHPLLFPTADGSALWALNPLLAFSSLGLVTKVPPLRNRNYAGLITRMKPLLGTTTPKARLRSTQYRGVESATMIYDQLPINDVFRRLDDDTVVGAMDLRGSTAPYFFVLVRDDSLPLR